MKHNLESSGKSIPKRLHNPPDLDVLALSKDSIPYEKYDMVNGENILDKYDFNHEYATLDEIYTLKLSHIFWDNHQGSSKWETHMNDIVALKNMGCKRIDELYIPAKKEWIRRFGKSGASLNANKKEFFSSGVDRYVDHDSIHACVAFYDRPLFYEFLKNGEEVLTDKNKFFAMEHEKQLRAVQEETMVLSLERDIVPLPTQPDKIAVRRAYMKNLKKLVTQYSSGWFPEFIVDYWTEVVQLPKGKDMIEDFLNGLDSGVILPGELWERKDETWWV